MSRGGGNMNMPWYEIVEASASITQGDIIMDCPIVAWREDSFTVTPDYSAPEEVLETLVDYVSLDTVI